ncbi:hypothetical protein [Oceaniferula spumae]|uniref:hypothetical protein n=1 Tax=Oceaniferula spumae TaxID=2979115 RepID=UPI003F4ECE26
MLLTSLSIGSLSSVSAAKYLRPDESKELFKLEKIPLQVDSMKELSKHLTIVAKRQQDDSAVNRRTTGQLLAIAMRLDPANQEARETNRSLQRDVAFENSNDGQITKAKARLRFYQRWLASPDAGKDANDLANYITDATRVLTPDTLNNDDQADWTGVIPPLDRYQKRQPTMPETDHTDRTEKTDDEAKPTPPKEDNSEKSNGSYQIPQLSINMPLAMEKAVKYRDPKDNFQEKTRYHRTYVVCPIKLSISPRNGDQPTSIKFKQSMKTKDEDKQKNLDKAVEQLEQRLGAKGKARMEVEFGTSSYSSQNGPAALAAIELMAEASRANKALRNDIFLCASLDSSNKLCLPPNFWLVLKSLRTDTKNRGRLIVPKSAIKPMTQLLVFSEPDFFTRWEVFTVETIQEAIAVAAKSTDKNIAEAGELFAPVRNLSGKTDVTKLAVNRAVRKRMENIVALAPNHLSARILLLQGSGKRPMRLSRTGLAFQIQPIVKHMSYTLTQKINPDSPTASTLKDLHVAARAELDPIERLVNRSDDELYQETLRLANDLRSLNLLIKRSERDEDNDKSRIKAMVFSLQKGATALEARVDQAVKAAAE